MVQYRTGNFHGFESDRRLFASDLEQVCNLLHVQVNSASYPQWDKK